ncbi:MAG TPA: SLBB domain-containing protein, partial [bacterium]|nr:SLBB domain-containing protein [bacterium]
GEPEDIALDAQVADNGTLTLPWIDPVQVSGLTLAEASEEVRKAYSRIYKRAFAQLLLRRLGSFQIQLAGYYNYPGLYRVYNGTTLYGLLLLLNLDANGERRFMTLHRLKEPAPPHTMPSLSAEAMTPVGDFDPFDFSVKGRFDLDVALEPWDRLVITRPTTVIRLDRGVTRPGAYAVKPGEGLLDILQLAGQVDMTADLQNTTVTRYDETGAPQVSYLDLASAIRDNQMIEVADRDRYYLVSYSRHVFVLGEVAAPGAYPVLPGEGLVELIGRAGGFTENAHTKFISVVRPPRFLKDRPAVENQVEMVDMRAYMKKGSDRERYAIQPGDVIFIPDKGNRLGPGDLFRGALSALGVIVS